MNPIEALKEFIQDNKLEAEFLANRPQTAMERVKNFPLGVKALLRDCLRYQTVAETPINSWCIEDSHGRKVQLGKLPRRQYVQQHQLIRDFKKMLPLVIIWIPPIIGFLPTILAVVAPRQSMSRHFHNRYELETFAQIEYSQRFQAFPRLADMLCGPILLGSKSREAIAGSLLSDNWAEDDTEPTIDALTLYKTLFAGDRIGDVASSLKIIDSRPGSFSSSAWSLKSLSRDYLVSLPPRRAPSIFSSCLR